MYIQIVFSRTHEFLSWKTLFLIKKKKKKMLNYINELLLLRIATFSRYHNKNIIF